MIQGFDSASAQANLNLMGIVLNTHMGQVKHITFLVEKWENMLCRQDERTGGQ